MESGVVGHPSTEHSWGFAFRLGVSLVAVVSVFAHPPAVDDFVITHLGEAAWSWVLAVLCLGAPAFWISQTAFAYRHYGKEWRWFLLGAPWALYELMVLSVLILVVLSPNRSSSF
jgi:hypothetical protein